MPANNTIKAERGGGVPETKKIFSDKRQEAVFLIALEKFKEKNFEGKKGVRKSDKERNDSARKTLKDMADKNSEAVRILAEIKKEDAVKAYGEAAGYLWEAAQNIALKEMEKTETNDKEKENAQKAEEEKMKKLEEIKNNLTKKFAEFGDKFEKHGEEIAKLSEGKKKEEMKETERKIINNYTKIEKALKQAQETLLSVKSEEKAENMEKTLQRLSAELVQNQESIRNLATVETVEKPQEEVQPQEKIPAKEEEKEIQQVVEEVKPVVKVVAKEEKPEPEIKVVPEAKPEIKIETVKTKENDLEILKNEASIFKKEIQKYISGEEAKSMPADFIDTAKAYLVLVEKAEDDEERGDFEKARTAFLADLKDITDKTIVAPEKAVLPTEEKKGFFGKIWNKTKEVFGKSKEVLKKEEVRDMAAETAYKSITSVLGVKFATDLVRAIGGKGDIADYYKHKMEEGNVKEKFASLLRQSEKNKTVGKENLKKEEETAFIARARELFYEINKSDRSPKEKQEMKDKLKKLVKQYDSEKGNTEKQAQTAVIDIVDDYTKNKVSGVSIAKDFLNTLTTATGTYALRGVIYGTAAAAEKYLKLRKENRRRESSGETRKGILKELTVGSFNETLKELNVLDKEKTATKKVIDVIKASGVLLRVAGIGGLAIGELHQEGAGIIEKTLENIKNATEHGVLEKGGALNNFAANFDRLTLGSTNLSEKIDSLSGKISSEVLASGTLMAQGLENDTSPNNEDIDMKLPWEKEEPLYAEEKLSPTDIPETTETPEPVEIDTTIHKGDGYYDVFKRQIEADPEKFGFKDEGDVDDFIEKKTKEFLKINNLWKNGKSVGLIYNPEAKIVLNSDGSFTENNVETYKMEIPKPKVEIPQTKVTTETSLEKNESPKMTGEEIIAENKSVFNKADRKELDEIYSKTVKDIQKDFGDAKAQKFVEKMDVVNKRLNDLENVVSQHKVEGSDNLAGRLKDLKTALLKAQEDEVPANYKSTLSMLDDIKATIDSDIKIIENQTGGGQTAESVNADLSTEQMIAENYENLAKAGEHKEAAMRSLGLSNEEIINKIQEEADTKEAAGRALLEKEKLAEMQAEEAKIDKAFAQEEINAKASEMKWQEMQKSFDTQRAQSQQEIDEMFKNLQRRYVDDPENLSKLNRQLEKSQSILAKASLVKDSLKNTPEDKSSLTDVIEKTSKSLDKSNIDFFKKLPHVQEAQSWAKDYSGAGEDKVQEALLKLNTATKETNSADYLKAVKRIEELKNEIEKTEKVGLVGILNKEKTVDEVMAKPIDPADRAKLDAIRQEAHDAEIKAKEEVARYAAEQEEANKLKEIKTERMKATAGALDNRAAEISLSLAEKQTAKAFEDAYKYLEEKQKEVDFIRSVDAEKESFNIQKEIKALEKLSRALEKANEKGVPLDKEKVNDFVVKMEMIKRNSDNDGALEAIKEAEDYLKKGGKLDKYMEMVKDAVSQVLRGPNS
ncbi:MAG TPA: hypothetical protein P5230_00820 [Candidatus Magasanikbacteria bacterium]|nr:hypothetical protein [Candidatus Magasanikbacteria bacterium]